MAILEVFNKSIVESHDTTEETDLTLLKFEMMLESIEEQLLLSTQVALQGAVADSHSKYSCSKPLLLIFDEFDGNAFRKFILQKPRVYLPDWRKKYDIPNFPEEADKNIIIKATRDFVEECRTDKLFNASVIFIFWALLAASVDKSDYDKNTSKIADFAHLLHIENDMLVDLTTLIKVIFREENMQEAKFYTKEFDNIFFGFSVQWL